MDNPRDNEAEQDIAVDLSGTDWSKVDPSEIDWLSGTDWSQWEFIYIECPE